MIHEGRVTDQCDDWTTLQGSLDRAKDDYDRQPELHPSDQIRKLLTLGEDHRCFSHPGFDPLALIRVAWRTCMCGRREGGSTIAMQLVRTLTGAPDIVRASLRCYRSWKSFERQNSISLQAVANSVVKDET